LCVNQIVSLTISDTSQGFVLALLLY